MKRCYKAVLIIFRLKDESKVCSIIDKVRVYLDHHDNQTELCRIYLRKIEHLYYKFDARVLEQKAVSIYNTLFLFVI